MLFTKLYQSALSAGARSARQTVGNAPTKRRWWRKRKNYSNQLITFDCSLTNNLTQEKVDNFKEMFQMFDKVID